MNSRVLGSLLVAAGLLTAFPAVGQTLAWWVTWSTRPTATEIEGVPVQQLHPNWRRASVTRPSDLPIDGTRPEHYGLALSMDADLDGDALRERAMVGVFETDRGARGRFLLVLARGSNASAWTKKALFTIEGSAFSAIDLHLGTLRWHACLSCDDICVVIRSGDGFRLRCERPLANTLITDSVE